jgi:hypothetical protein
MYLLICVIRGVPTERLSIQAVLRKHGGSIPLEHNKGLQGGTSLLMSAYTLRRTGEI